MEEGRGKTGDLELLESHTHLLGPGHTFCALAPGAAEPLQSGLKYFRDDFERHIHEKRLPLAMNTARVCKCEANVTTIHIDNRPYPAKDGENLLQECLSLGFNLPYFCWHPALGRWARAASARSSNSKMRKTRGQDGHGVHDAATDGDRGFRLRSRGEGVPRQRDRMADGQSSARLPGV